VTKVSWPAWWYGPEGQGKVFQSADEVPEGWKDTPFKPGETPELPAAAKTKPKTTKTKATKPKKRRGRPTRSEKAAQDAARTEALNVLREAGVEIADDASDKDIQAALEALG